MTFNEKETAEHSYLLTDSPHYDYNPINSIKFKVRVYTDKTIIPFLPSTPQWYPEDER